jgi:hypothetical protein
MQRIIVKFAEEPGTAACSSCAQPTRWTKGPRLVRGEDDAALCRVCGQRQVPSLVALLDLAHVADKVGRQCRHLLTPPMESLLDLARAAENYSTSVPKRAVAALRS